MSARCSRASRARSSRSGRSSRRRSGSALRRERASEDERRRALERAAATARTPAERGEAEVALAALARRRGDLEVAALRLEEAVRAGALEAAAAEVAALVEADPGEAGAQRAARVFAAVGPSAVAPGPFPLAIAWSATDLLARRGRLFKDVFAAVPERVTARLATSMRAMLPEVPAMDTPRALLESVLLRARRRRRTARLDDPGPLAEVGAFEVETSDPAEFSIAASETGFAVLHRGTGRRASKLALTLLGYSNERAYGNDLATTVPVAIAPVGGSSPLLASAGAGTWIVATRSAKLWRFVRVAGLRAGRVGVETAVHGTVRAFACSGASSALIVGPPERVLVSGTKARWRALVPGFTVLAAAWRGGDLVVLATSSRRSAVVELGTDRRALEEFSRVELPALERASLVLLPDGRTRILAQPDRVIDLPENTERRLDGQDLATIVSGRSNGDLDDDVIAFGPIEREWGGHGDIGIARWRIDGARLGPTVRLERDPDVESTPQMAVAPGGRLLAVAWSEASSIRVRVLATREVEAQRPAPAEWVVEPWGTEGEDDD
jgi:hypothetical protein